MAREEVTDKSIDELIARAWKIAEAADTATLITVENDMAIARPISAKTHGNETEKWATTRRCRHANRALAMRRLAVR